MKSFSLKKWNFCSLCHCHLSVKLLCLSSFYYNGWSCCPLLSICVVIWIRVHLKFWLGVEVLNVPFMTLPFYSFFFFELFVNLTVIRFLWDFFYFFMYLQIHEAQDSNDAPLKYSKCSKIKKDDIIPGTKAQTEQTNDVIPGSFLWTNFLQHCLRVVALGFQFVHINLISFLLFILFITYNFPVRDQGFIWGLEGRVELSMTGMLVLRAAAHT